MPDNPKSQTPGSEGESTGITVADAVRLIPQVFRQTPLSPQNITAAPLSHIFIRISWKLDIQMNS